MPSNSSLLLSLMRFLGRFCAHSRPEHAPPMMSMTPSPIEDWQPSSRFHLLLISVRAACDNCSRCLNHSPLNVRRLDFAVGRAVVKRLRSDLASTGKKLDTYNKPAAGGGDGGAAPKKVLGPLKDWIKVRWRCLQLPPAATTLPFPSPHRRSMLVCPPNCLAAANFAS
jgi:hypothetical protein